MTQSKKKQSISGEVVSDKMKDTVVVIIKNKHRAPLYGKYITRIQKIFAHDPNNKHKVGDWVTIEPCRPISKKKSWSVVNELQN
jgi:small subunit ribosomal protein S17